MKKKDCLRSVLSLMVAGAPLVISSIYQPVLLANSEIENSDQQFEEFGGTGVGLKFDPDTKQIIVTTLTPGSPSELAGILINDILLKVDDTSTQGMDIDTAVKLIRGEAGTKVTLTMKRGEQELRFPLIRKSIRVEVQSTSPQNTINQEQGSNQCDSAIEFVKSDINNRIGGRVEDIRWTTVDNSPYTNANQSIMIVMSNTNGYEGKKNRDIMGSNQLQVSLGDKIIRGCSSVIKVDFAINYTDYIRGVYWYNSRETRKEICVPFGKSISQWGQVRCL